MYDNYDENYYSSDLSDNEEGATPFNPLSNAYAMADELVACDPLQKNKIILVLTSKFGVFSLAPHLGDFPL